MNVAPMLNVKGFAAIHPSHRKWSLNGEIVFCWNCGYLMKKKAQRLKDKCEGEPAEGSIKHIEESHETRAVPTNKKWHSAEVEKRVAD